MRRWTAGGVERHHLLDPRSGHPIDNGLDAVTVIAGDAYVAEILTKAAFVAGAGLLAQVGIAGVLVESLDRLRIAGPFAAFVVRADTVA